jgi:hypothetical protein
MMVFAEMGTQLDCRGRTRLSLSPYIESRIPLYRDGRTLTILSKENLNPLSAYC